VSPIYEYFCNTCSRTVELLQRRSDPPACPSRGCKRKMELVWSRPARPGAGGKAGGYGQTYTVARSAEPK
jgi:putative FmdB family regulatory protein